MTRASMLHSAIFFTLFGIFLCASENYTAWDVWSSNPDRSTSQNKSAFNSTKRKYLLEGKLRDSAFKGDFPVFAATLELGRREKTFNEWAGDHNGRTWLHFASIAGNGGDPAPVVPPPDQSNFLTAAFELTMKDRDVSDRDTYINVRDESGQTPLHEAALNGQLETFKTLLTFNANIAARALPLQGDFALGWTMMDWLAANGPYREPDVTSRAEKLAALDQIIANFQNALTSEKRSAPVFVDVSTNNPDECVCTDIVQGCCVQYNVAASDGVNNRYRCRGMTVLDYAVLRNRTAIVKYILSLNRAARYWKSNWCELPIHKAAQLGYADIVQIFLDLEKNEKISCDSTIHLMKHRAQGRENILHMAALGGHQEVLDTLYAACRQQYQSLRQEVTASGDSSFVWNGEKPCDLSQAANSIIKYHCSDADGCSGRHRSYCTQTALNPTDRTPCLYDDDCMAIDVNSKCVNLGETFTMSDFTHHQATCNSLCQDIKACP